MTRRTVESVIFLAMVAVEASAILFVAYGNRAMWLTPLINFITG